MSPRIQTSKDCPKADHAYGTEAEAKDALLDVKIYRGLKRGGRSSEQRAYRCTICKNAWHLTSRG